jgi:alpha-2-macroglobulin
MRLLLALIVALALPSWGQDTLRFWCQPQSCPGSALHVGVERQQKWDEKTRAWKSEPTPLGTLKVTLFRCEPKGSLFNSSISLSPAGGLDGNERLPQGSYRLFRPDGSASPHYGNDGVAVVTTLGDPQSRKKEKRGYQEVWVWEKRIVLPGKDQAWSLECSADPDKGFQIPPQPIGTYVLEIERGEERAFLPWRVTNLAIRAEVRQDQILLYGFRPIDGSPLSQGVIKARIRTRDARDWNKWTDSEESLHLNSKGAVAIRLKALQTLVETELQSDGERLVATTEINGRTTQERIDTGSPLKPRRAFVYTDRPVYKPGDELFLKVLLDAPGFDPRKDLVSVFSALRGRYPNSYGNSWLKPFGGDPGEETGAPAYLRPLTADELRTLGLAYTINGSGSNQNLTGVAALVSQDPLTFSGGMKLPASLRPGTYNLSVSLQGGTTSATFDVQTNEKPRFSVRFIDGAAPAESSSRSFSVEARALDGAPVPTARGEWNFFRFVNRQGGAWFEQGQGLELKGRGDLVCDRKGSAKFQIPSDQVDPNASYRLLVKITDAGGQRQMVSRALGRSAGGIRVVLDRDFALPNEPILARVESDGVIQSLTMAAFKAETGENPFWSDSRLLRRGARVTELGRDGGTLKLPDGAYLVVAEGVLATGEKVSAQQFLLVADEGTRLPLSSNLRASLDGRSLLPGGKARVLVLLPREGLTLRWRVEGAGFLREETKKITGTTALIDFPLEERLYPNGWITLSAASDGKYFEQTIPLELTLDRDRLKIALVPEKPTYLPGERGRMSIEVTDASGRAVRSDVSLSVVDEALFLLAPETMRDPVAWFHPDRSSVISSGASLRDNVADALSREVLEPLQRDQIRGAAADMVVGTGGEYVRASDQQSAPELKDLRDHFLDTALWVPSVVVHGKTKVEVPFPDDLTTWRATAVAFSSGLKAGIGRASSTVSKPLQLTLVLPQVLTEGDEARALALLKNRGTTALQGMVRINADGAEVMDAAKPFDLKPGEERRLAFGLKALQGNAHAKIVAMAESEGISDGEKREIRILIGNSEVRRAGCLRQTSSGEELKIPSLPEVGGPVAVSLFAVDNALERLLRPSLGYLMEYPYGCVEQTLSRFVPNVIIQDLVKRGLLSPLPENETGRLERNVREGLLRLSELRKPLGCWGWYGSSDFGGEVSLHATGQALWGLAMMQQAQALDSDVWSQVNMSWKPSLLEHWRNSKDPSKESMEQAAFFLYACAESASCTHPNYQKPLDQELDIAIKALDADPSHPNPGTLGLIVLTAALRKHEALPSLLDRLEKTAHNEHGFVYWDGPQGPSSRLMPTVFALKALCRHRPSSPLIAPTEAYLVSRFDGRGWGSTWATSHVLALLPDLSKVRRLRWMGGPEMVVSVEGLPPHDFKNDGNAFTFTIPASKEMKLSIKGDGLLVWSQQAGSNKPMSSPCIADALLEVKRELFRLEVPGSKTSPEAGFKRVPWTGSLVLGEEALMEVEVHTNKALNYALVEIPIPASLEADGRLDDFVLEGKQVAQTIWSRPEIHPDRVAFLLYGLAPNQPQTIHLRLRARMEGRYKIKPVRFSLMGDESQWVTTEGRSVTILPETAE